MERVNQLLAKTLIATALLGAMLAPALTQGPPRIKGADLFVDLQQYVGKEVILTDAKVRGTDNSGSFIYAGAVTFWLSNADIDRETLRFFLTNWGRTECDVPLLLVTPTGEKRGLDWPILKSAKIIK